VKGATEVRDVTGVTTVSSIAVKGVQIELQLKSIEYFQFTVASLAAVKEDVLVVDNLHLLRQ
jgi:hypothetical protein